MATCRLCGAVFASRRQLGPHARSCVRLEQKEQDDEDVFAIPAAAEAAVITNPVGFDDDAQSVPPTPLMQLARRSIGDSMKDLPGVRICPVHFVTRPASTPNDLARDFREVLLFFNFLDFIFFRVFVLIYATTPHIATINVAGVRELCVQMLRTKILGYICVCQRPDKSMSRQGAKCRKKNGSTAKLRFGGLDTRVIARIQTVHIRAIKHVYEIRV